jgi:ligand-binding sensor domain-containing protein/signal transduction histidine kinase
MFPSVFPHLLRLFRPLLIACLLAVASDGRARGDDFVQQTWKTDEGLPHSIVNQVCQDKTGHLWIATGAGLARFDGREFKRHVTPRSLQHGGINVRDIAVESDTCLIAVVASGKVLRFEQGAFSPHPISAALGENQARRVFVARNGVVWLGSGEGMVLRWANGEAQMLGEADGLGDRRSRLWFAEDASGRLWIAAGSFLGWYADGKLTRHPTLQAGVFAVSSSRSGGAWVIADGRLLRLSDDGLTATVLVAEPPWVKANAAVWQLLEDSRGDVWISSVHRGLTRWRDGVLTPVAAPFDTVHALFEDNEGNIWTGTDGDGLSVLKPKPFRWYNRETGLPEIITRAVCSDASGHVWFANVKGGLILKRGPEILLPAGAWAGVEAYAVHPDREGSLWVGTDEGVFIRPAKNHADVLKPDIPIKSIRVFYPARDGAMWIASNRNDVGFWRDGAFHFVSAPERFPPSTLNAIREDADGTIWLGGSTGTLFRHADKRLVPVAPQDGLPPVPIHALCVDRAGVLWVGTANGLLMRDGDRFVRLSEADGLPDSMILQLVEDDRGHLWFGTRGGYFHVSAEKLRQRALGSTEPVSPATLGRDDGLAGVLPIATSQPSAWKDESGLLWFTTHQGVLSIDPGKLRSAPPAPSVLIDEVLIDGAPAVMKNGQVVIPPGQHHLDFRFSAIALSAPGKVRLRHRLSGADPEWIQTNSARAASYSGLSPGTYTLEVAARGEESPWSGRVATLEIVARPHLWETTWFRMSALGLCVAATAWAARYLSEAKLRRQLEQLEREHALEKERARIARDVHDDLGSSVTGVRFLVSRLKENVADPAREVLLDQLSSQTQRLAFDLERVVWTVTPRNNSLDRLVAFAGKFVQNFFRGSGIECRIERETPIPPCPLEPEVQHHLLALTKEAANNALKHSRATQVTLSTRFSDGVFTLSMRDNGLGFVVDAPEHSERNGLGNMRTRASEIGGSLEIRSKLDAGTEIRISVPMAMRPPPPV